MKRRRTVHHDNQLELALFDEPQSPTVATDESNAIYPPPSEVPREPMPIPEEVIHEPLLWQDEGWSARVIRNDTDDGWAVAITKDGEPEPALIRPWTMGRDKNNPKHLDAIAFAGLVKIVSEARRKQEQQLHAMLHKSVTVTTSAATVTVALDIDTNEDHPYATLSAYDEAGALLAQMRVAPAFTLSKHNATAWVEDNFRQPGNPKSNRRQ